MPLPNEKKESQLTDEQIESAARYAITESNKEQKALMYTPNTRETFYLIDYKGKFTIICDEIDDMDIEVGKITRERALDKDEAEWRREQSTYYGVPAYIGKDKELNNFYN